MSKGIDQFLVMWAKWKLVVPAVLQKEDAAVLIRLLQCGLTNDGVSQSELREELGINQPRLSKLSSKLEKLGWVSVNDSEEDGRVVLLSTTADAKNWLESFEKMLTQSKPQKKTAVRRPAREQDQPPGFDFNVVE